MDLYEQITDILTSINSKAKCYFLEKSRFESETLNMIDPCVNIYPNFNGDVNLVAYNFKNKSRFEIDFLKQDEWDNADYENMSGTYQIIEQMRFLANAVLLQLQKNNDLSFNTYHFENMVRINSNTMSGIKLTINIEFIDKAVCDYEL